MSARLIALPIALAAQGCASAVAAPEPAPPASEWAAQCKDWDDWDKPGPPFLIYGNTWYVGTCGIGAILVTGDDGHVLIDSGTNAGADVVLSNIRAAGFDPKDITLLLTSHEHWDHVGGMAKMQAVTGADLMTSEPAAEVMRSGNPGKDDPQFAIAERMEPVPAVGLYAAGNKYGDILDRLGLRFLATPGHTPGAMSWTWESCEGSDCRTIVYADSLSPISADGYKFSDHPEYVAAFRMGLAELAELDCDILLTPHPSASEMRTKLLARDMTSGMNCREYAEIIDTRLTKRLAEEVAQ